MPRSIANSNWKPQTPIPAPKSNGLLLSSGNNLFYIGGSTDALTSGTQEIYRAPVYAGGEVGLWQVVGIVPKLMAFFGGVIKDGNMILAGGNTTAPTDSLYIAKVSADGSLSNLIYSPILWTSFRNPSVIVEKGFVYCIAGATSSPANKEVFSGQLLDAKVTTWKAQTPLPLGASFQCAVQYGGFIYVIAGSPDGLAGSSRSDVYSARVEDAGGLGVWTKVGDLPVAMFKMTACVFGNKLIVLGGQNTAGTNVDTMYVSTLELGGGLGAFISDEVRVPIAHRNASAAIVGKRLYLASGFTTVRLDQVNMIELG